jgi:hypothetical protein
VTTVYDSGDYPALFDELLRRLDYDGERGEQARLNAGPGLRRGIGVAVYVEKTGLGPFETTHIEALADGRFTVDTGASSMGPGLETVLAQIIGDALQLPADRFRVRHPDTAAIESGVGTYGSRGTVTAGNAGAMAAAKLVEEARRRAAKLWGVPEDGVDYAAGVLAHDGRRVSLAELARQQRLAVGASFTVPKLTYAGCAVGVVVDVDAETGQLHLRKIAVGADVGRAVNPALVDGQLTGGVAFGIGNTLLESLEYDGDGQLMTGTTMDARSAGPGRVRQPGAQRRDRERGLRRAPRLRCRADVAPGDPATRVRGDPARATSGVVAAVRSVADSLREEDRAELAALTPGERVALALALGDRDLETFRLAQCPRLSRDEAVRILERRRQATRRPCRCIEELIG